MIVEKVYEKIRVILTAILVVGINTLLASGTGEVLPRPDDIMNRMSLEEKVGQLIWLEVTDQTLDLDGLLKKFNPAGISIVTNDPNRVKNWSNISTGYAGKSYVLVDTDISELAEMTLFPQFKSTQNILNQELVQKYKEVTLEQMRHLGIDRSEYYGMDLDIDLKRVTGHSETLKKALFETDGIIISGDPSYWYGEIYRLVKTGEIPRSFFEAKVEKILDLKEKLHNTAINDPQVLDYLLSFELNKGGYKALVEQFYLASFNHYKAHQGKIPVKNIDGKNILHISLAGNDDIFIDYINKYLPIRSCQYISLSNIDISDSRVYDQILLELSGTLSWEDVEILKRLDAESDLIITYFGAQQELKKLKSLSSVLSHPENNPITRRMAPQIIFGGLSLDLESHTPIRLSYTSPESAGLDSRILREIDNVADELIEKRAAPGCQILVARNGHVVYNKSFGSLFYNDSIPVTTETLYDLASITKVLATLPAVMYLDQVDLIDINQRASDYLHELRGTDKENVLIRDILIHQAGLYPYLPFWKQTVNEEGPIPGLYSEEKENDEWKLVSNGLYSNESLQDSLWRWTIESRMRRAPKDGKSYDYKYSDLGFYIMRELVERVSGMKLDQFSNKYLYKPLGLETLTFQPLSRFGADRIAPTELDTYFRKDMVHGTVHDQTAAMFGGVAGHAGLFSNTNDLAKIMQMFLWDGKYGNGQYFDRETISKYTNKQNPENRRGLGWDKPDPEEEGNTSPYASLSSFGHTGFTGTSVWADPEYGLIYVFLSNRVHPNANNNRLGRGNYRIRIQDVIYSSMQEYEKSNSF